MQADNKTLVAKYTRAVKKIIYDKDRMSVFLKLLQTPDGAIHAAHLVIAMLEKSIPVPPQIVHQLAVNAYLLMTHLALDITGHKVNPKTVQYVVGQILQSFDDSHSQAPVQSQSTPAQSTGIIGRKMGGAA